MKILIGAGIMFLLLMQVSCRNETKTAILPVDSMKVIMWDMMKADEWFSRKITQDTNAIRNKEDVKLYEMVFKVHGITRERYFASYRYYEGRPASFKVLLDSIDALANRERLKRYQIERGSNPATQPKK